MDINAAFTLLKDEMTNYDLIAEGWTSKLDDSRRRFGVCMPKEKVISLSRLLIELNSEEEVRDTILHEIAHALAWERHRANCGHDQRWKDICIEIGARPERCFDDSVIQPDAPWMLCHSETGEVFSTYHRKPSNDFSARWIRGRKDETFGKLVVRPNTGPSSPSAEFPQFSHSNAMALRDEILSAITPIIKARGLTLEEGKGSYNKQEFSWNLIFRIPLPEGANPEKEEFELYAPIFNLSPADYMRPFRMNGKTFLLTGFMLKNRKYPIIGKDSRGTQYKFSLKALESLEN